MEDDEDLTGRDSQAVNERAGREYDRHMQKKATEKTYSETIEDRILKRKR